MNRGGTGVMSQSTCLTVHVKRRCQLSHRSKRLGLRGLQGMVYIWHPSA